MNNENEYIFWPLTPLFLNPKNYRPCVLRDLQWSAALHCGTNNCVISSYNGNLTHYILLNLHLNPALSSLSKAYRAHIQFKRTVKYFFVI